MLRTAFRHLGDGGEPQMVPQETARRSATDRQPHFMREWRLSHDLTLMQMVAALEHRCSYKITAGALSRVENGQRQYTQDLLEAYSAVLGCTVGDLLSRTPQDPDDFYRLIVKLQEEYYKFVKPPEKPKKKRKR